MGDCYIKTRTDIYDICNLNYGNLEPAPTEVEQPTPTVTGDTYMQCSKTDCFVVHKGAKPNKEADFWGAIADWLGFD